MTRKGYFFAGEETRKRLKPLVGLAPELWQHDAVKPPAQAGRSCREWEFVNRDGAELATTSQFAHGRSWVRVSISYGMKRSM